jgi:peptidoglycan/xylan/chitin deacetylase (PgdA/CDA1 family)
MNFKMSFWPEPYSSALSLTFDDGMPSHLEIVIPELDRRGLRGTFYLNPSGDDDEYALSSWQRQLAHWIPAAQAGHEMGNHSLQHPCSLNIPLDWAPNLLDMTLAELEQDIREAQRRLSAVFPMQKATSFAYPCYETSLGRGRSRVSYVPLIARLFTAGRARGELANDPQYCDLHCLSSMNVERQTAAFLIGLAELALAQGRWAILTFHGINEGHLPVAGVDFIDFLDHLARRRTQIWVAPVAEIATYINSRIHP